MTKSFYERIREKIVEIRHSSKNRHRRNPGETASSNAMWPSRKVMAKSTAFRPDLFLEQIFMFGLEGFGAAFK